MERLSVGVYGEDDVFRRGLVAVLNDADCDCIVFGSEREMSPESGGRGLTLDVAVVSSRSLAEVELSCPIVLLTTSELAPQETHQASTNVMATLLREGLTSEQLVASVRAAAAGLQVESSSLSRRDGQILDPRRIEVLKLLATGADTRAIARNLDLSERTVKTLIHDIELTLGASTRAQAVAEGVRLGLI